MNRIQRNRVMQAAVLTAVVTAFLLTIGGTFGIAALALSAITLPVPLTLLWLSADVLRADEWATIARERLGDRSVASAAVGHSASELSWGTAKAR